MQKNKIATILCMVTLLFSFSGCQAADVTNNGNDSTAPISEPLPENSSESGNQANASSTETSVATVTYAEEDLPKNSPDDQAYVDLYMTPFAVTGIFNYSFSPSNMDNLLGLQLKTIFNAFYSHDYPDGELQLSDLDTDVPEDVFEGTLMSHLDLSSEQIRESCALFYNKEKKVYTASFGLGGGDGKYIITDSSMEASTLSLDYDLYTMDYDTPMDNGYRWMVYAQGNLHIEINDDNYKFISNQVTVLE